MERKRDREGGRERKGGGGEKKMEKTKKKKKRRASPQLCRRNEKRGVNKRGKRERRGKKKSLESTSHSERCSATGTRSLFHSLRPSLNIFSFPLFSPPSLPPLHPSPPSLLSCLSVSLFVIWPSRSFKSASPFPPFFLVSLTPSCSPSRPQSAILLPLTPRSLTWAHVDWFCLSTSPPRASFLGFICCSAFTSILVMLLKGPRHIQVMA